VSDKALLDLVAVGELDAHRRGYLGCQFIGLVVFGNLAVVDNEELGVAKRRYKLVC
jgi:hypothetical protein